MSDKRDFDSDPDDRARKAHRYGRRRQASKQREIEFLREMARNAGIANVDDFSDRSLRKVLGF